MLHSTTRCAARRSPRRPLTRFLQGKPMELRLSNMVAAKGALTGCAKRKVSDYNSQPSVMPCGRRWDQGEWTKWCVHSDDWEPAGKTHGLQIQTSKGETIVTNDGATILKSIQALHPAAKMVRSQSIVLPFALRTFRSVGRLICRTRHRGWRWHNLSRCSCW